MSREFEIAVFGATGYTGEKIVQYLTRGPLSGLQKSGKKIALAGRRPAALKEVQDRALAAAGDQSLSSAMEIVTADVSDAKSLDSLCARSRLLINCVGPFRFFGEPVVQACVSQGTHYVDITGEPEFIETMMLKYDAEAKAKKILLIPSCGFDSLPADLGHVFASQQFLKAHPDGAVSTMECFLGGTAPNGVQVHYATWESAVHGFANAHKLRNIRKQLRARQSDNNVVAVPRVGPKLQMPSYYFEKRLNKWCIPFPGSDASVVANTQYLEAEESKGKCAPQPHYAEYFAFGSVLTLILLMVIGVFFKILTGFEAGRQLLLKHSSLFSLGFVSHAGPSQKILDTATFNLTYFVRGYTRKPTGDSKEQPDAELKVVVSGPEPGYVTCSIVVSQAALTILALEDSGKLDRVGVLTPGFALGHTDLAQKLTAEHVLFSAAQ